MPRKKTPKEQAAGGSKPPAVVTAQRLPGKLSGVKTNNLVSVLDKLDELERVCAHFAKAGYYDIINADQHFVMLLKGQDLGIGLGVYDQYYPVHGKPSLGAYPLLARFHARGGESKWKTGVDDKEKATLWCKANHLPGKPELEVTFTFGMAKEYGFTDKPKEKGGGLKHNWQYKRPYMLRCRAITTLLDMLDPGCRGNEPIAEVMMDLEPDAEVIVVDANVEESGIGSGMGAAPAQEPEPEKKGGKKKGKTVKAPVKKKPGRAQLTLPGTKKK